MNRIRARDKGALVLLYDRYSGALYGAILRIIRDELLAEELLQDAFLKFWDKIDGYDEQKGRPFTWMLNIARNLAIDKTRSKEISKQSKTEDIGNLVSTVNNLSVDEVKMDVMDVVQHLQRLPAEQRHVVEYLYLKGYTQTELAEESGIPLGTIKTRLRLAMLELRKMYQVN